MENVLPYLYSGLSSASEDGTRDTQDTATMNAAKAATAALLLRDTADVKCYSFYSLSSKGRSRPSWMRSAEGEI